MATTKKSVKKTTKTTAKKPTIRGTSYDRFSAGDGAFGKANTPCKYFVDKGSSKKKGK